MNSFRPLPGFQIESLVRTGSRSALYRGRRLADGAGVLLLRLREGRATLRARQRLDRERRVLAELEHPAIARLLEVVEDGSEACLVLADPGGELLAQAYPAGSISFDDFLELARALARALAVVHDAGYVHRNMKLDSAFADVSTGSITLLNFSLATRMGDAPRAASDRLMGSPAYLAPEQSGRVALGVDRRTDQYGLGVTLYQLLCGELPFPADDPVELVHAHIAREPVPPSAFRDGIPPALDAALLRLLDKDPTRRYPSLAAFVQALDAMRSDAPALERLPAPAPLSSPRRRGAASRTVEIHAARLFDHEAVLRAAQEISSELVLENLLEKLLWILLVNSGARRAVILLASDGELLVEAHGGVGEPPEVLCGVALEDFEHVASGVVTDAARERAAVVLADAQADPRYAGDAHIAGASVRSLLCAPIQRHGALIGMMYLENDLIPGVFTVQRHALLSQIGVLVANAIANARLYDELDQARRAAIAADEIKTHFLLSMSHELRTPLNAMIGFTELLRDELEELAPGRFSDVLSALTSSGERLVRSFSNILEYSRVRAGEVTLHERACDVRALVTKLVDGARPIADAHGNELALTSAEELPAARLDEDKLRFVLTGLLDNACRLTRDGRVRVELARGGEGRRRLRITVTDTGPGISDSVRARLFEPFMQADGSPTRTHEGCGLTLAIASRFCEAMGGALTVEPGDTSGARFIVDLPLRQVE